MPDAILWPQPALPAPIQHRVLMLPYFFPPCARIGARRPEGLYRHLPEFGWEPVVITAGWGGRAENLLEIPDTSLAQSLRKRLGGGSTGAANSGSSPSLKRAAAHWIERHAGWGALIRKRAIAVGRQFGVSLVWTTCDPFALAETAIQVAGALDVPCVVDLRDPLPAYTGGATEEHWLLRAMRRTAVVTVAAPVCVTPELSRTGRPVPVILTGAWQNEPMPSRRGEQFLLLHAALPSTSSRDPRVLLAALALLAEELPGFRQQARLRMIGDHAGITALPGYPAVADMIDLRDAIPYPELAEMMTAAAILLLIKGDRDYVSRDAIPGKFYDYLPFAAPMLAMGGIPGILADLLAWTGSGSWVADPRAAADFIAGHFTDWQQGVAPTAPRHPEALAFLSQRRMAAECAEIFNAVVEGRDVNIRTLLPWEVA